MADKNDSPSVLSILNVLAGVFGLIGLGVLFGYTFGERAACKPEHYPSGSIGEAIAFCKDQGGSPSIDFRGRFECSKRVEVRVP